MRRMMLADNPYESDEVMSLDWAALGGLVRRRTLEAVARHFETLAAACGQTLGARSERPEQARSER